MGLEALRHLFQGLREGRQVRRAQTPRFWEGLWFLSAQEPKGPVGSQEDVHGHARMALFLDLKWAAPGNPNMFLSASA